MSADSRVYPRGGVEDYAVLMLDKVVTDQSFEYRTFHIDPLAEPQTLDIGGNQPAGCHQRCIFVGNHGRRQRGYAVALGEEFGKTGLPWITSS